MSFSRILCPLDLSPVSRCLVRHAIAQASGPHARVHVLHAVEPLLLQAATISGDPETLRREIEEDLQRVIRSATHGKPAPTFETSIAEGAADTAILEASARDEADLIVMGLHGMGAVSKACFGSTLERVLRASTTPVLALPAMADENGNCPPHALTRVVAAIDFQQPSMQAARLAAEYAEAHGATVTLLHVMPPANPWGRWGDAVAQQHAVRRERAENELVALAGELQQGRRRPQIEVREGSAWEEIAACGGERPGTLVVMGLAEPGRPFARPGSVAWRVLSAGVCPVLSAPAVRSGRSSRPRKRAARESYTEIA